MNNIINDLLKKKYIKEYVEKNKKLEGYIKLLIIAAMYNNIKITEENISHLDTFITDGRDDKGIDVIALVEEVDYSKTIYFIQHTTSSNKINDKINSKFLEMEEFTRAKETNNSKLSKKFKDIIKNAKDNKDKIYYKYIFIADIEKNNAICQSTWDINKRNKDRKIILRPKLNYHSLTFFVKNLPIEDFISKNPALFVYKDQIKINQPDENFKTYVGFIKAVSLIHSFKKYKKALFYENVRYYLGSGNKTNKEIEKTLEKDDAKHKFLQYNNGVTITYGKKVDQGQINKTFVFYESQIINGAQTVNTLVKWSESTNNIDNIEDLWVPIKLIQEDRKDEINLISKYSNSQSAIYDRDLYSNSKEQRKLQEYFLEKNILLSIKRNEFNTTNLFRKYKNISNEKLAQSFMATFLQKPNDAKNKKSQIFKNDDIYNSIFKISGFKENLYKCFLINEKISIALEKIPKEMNYFNFSLEYIIYLRLEEIDAMKNEINVFQEKLNNLIDMNFLNKLLNELKSFLLKNDLNENCEEKSLREISISSKLISLLNIFYQNLEWNK